MARNFKVTLELKLLLGNIDIILIRLFNKNNLVPVTSDDISGFFVTAVLKLNIGNLNFESSSAFLRSLFFYNEDI